MENFGFFFTFLCLSLLVIEIEEKKERYIDEVCFGLSLKGSQSSKLAFFLSSLEERLKISLMQFFFVCCFES